jgi:hypothetical protein
VVQTFPGQCSVRTDNGQPRLCLVNNDCFISGFDSQANAGETCGNTQTSHRSWVSTSTTVAGNKIQGPFVSGVTFAGIDTTVRENIITGPQRPAPPPPPPLPGSTPPPAPALPGAIFLVGPHALNTGMVFRNIVSNVHIALSLQSTFQNLPDAVCNQSNSACPNSCLGLKVFLNDFFDYDIAVQTDNGYNFLFTALSLPADDLEGNFWGSSCFDVAKVQKRNGTPQAAVKDCIPFTAPVAKASSFSLPSKCP